MRLIIFRNYREDLQLSMKAYANCIVKELRRRRSDWEIIEYYPKSLLVRLSRSDNVISKIVDLVNRYIYYPLQLKGAMTGDVYHIIDHANSLLMKYLNNDRVVVTCHDLIPLLMDKGYWGRLRKPILALKIFELSMRYLKGASKIFADSMSTKNDLITKLNVNESKIIYVPLALFYSFNVFSEDERIRDRNYIGVDERTLLILNVGNIFFYKNYERILRVLSLLPDNIAGRKWLFIRVGVKSKSSFLNYHLGGRHIEKIREVGVVSYEELEKYYNAADLLFFPSLYEGFGMPVLEAMHCGLPVITSNVGSLTEVGGDAVMYVDPHDIEDMVEKVLLLLGDDNLRSEMRLKGMQRAKLFSWGKTIELMIRNYEEISK